MSLEKITFKPANKWPDEPERHVHLCAYGGVTQLHIKGIKLYPSPSVCLAVDEIVDISEILTIFKGSFTIHNKSSVCGAALLSTEVETFQLTGIKNSHIFIEPRKCLIYQANAINIKIFCQLERDDLERIKNQSSDMIAIGTIRVILGSEPDRRRIVSILARNKESKLCKSYGFLVQGFPTSNLEQIGKFRDCIEHVNDLYTRFRQTEITLYINRIDLVAQKNHSDDVV